MKKKLPKIDTRIAMVEHKKLMKKFDDALEEGWRKPMRKWLNQDNPLYKMMQDAIASGRFVKVAEDYDGSPVYGCPKITQKRTNKRTNKRIKKRKKTKVTEVTSRSQEAL